MPLRKKKKKESICIKSGNPSMVNSDILGCLHVLVRNLWVVRLLTLYGIKSMLAVETEKDMLARFIMFTQEIFGE